MPFSLFGRERFPRRVISPLTKQNALRGRVNTSASFLVQLAPQQDHRVSFMDTDRCFGLVTSGRTRRLQLKSAGPYPLFQYNRLRDPWDTQVVTYRDYFNYTDTVETVRATVSFKFFLYKLEHCQEYILVL